MTATWPARELGAADAAAIRADFPILARTVRGGRPLIYLDTAATSQRPRPVLDAMREFAERSNAGVHRGAHALAEEATEQFEGARARLARFVGVDSAELVFTRGTTGALNLLARSLELNAPARPSVRAGDRIVVTEAEHHANLVPWQRLAARTGAELAWVPLDAEGRLDIGHLDRIVTPETAVVAFAHASNVTGAVADVRRIAEAARAVGAISVLDAAQSAPHLALDVRALGVDFAALSAHKMLGPNGIGALA
ncbi:MAG: aminotransferase class V-fold PLP-dependent enzyme, partial [Bifidobacteriaceae bacterium]|nr:aminotransferase class V-fold PLP-dependent enzyme [Bifidobacteriaceae bacterium]